MNPVLIVLGVVVVGLLLTRKIGGATIGGSAPGVPPVTPEQAQDLNAAADQRTSPGASSRGIDLETTVITVVTPAIYAVVGCVANWTMAFPLVRNAREGGNTFQFPPRLSPDPCTLPGVARPWWLPVYKADRRASPDNLGIALPDVEYVDGTPGVINSGTSALRQVRGFVVDGRAWVRSEASVNFRAMGAKLRGSKKQLALYVSVTGWTAFDPETGRNVPRSEVVLTYKGASGIPANANPWAVAPWADFADGRTNRRPGNGDEFKDMNPELPWDWCAPVYMWALLKRDHVTLPNAKATVAIGNAAAPPRRTVRPKPKD